MDQYIKRTDTKKVKVGLHHNIKITAYYLSEYDSGLRIEVRRTTLTKTVEIFLIIGDDIIVQKKEINKVTLISPNKKQIDEEISKLFNYAKDKKLL